MNHDDLDRVLSRRSRGTAVIRRALSLVACAGLALGGAEAAAQSAGAPPPAAPSAPGPTPTAGALSPSAKADLLFEEGRALLAKNEVDAACAKLEESHELDPAWRTLFNLATCEEQRKRFATAARRWKEGLRLFLADDGVQDKAANQQAAETRLAEAEAKAGRLVLRLAGDAPPSTTATLDGRVVTAAELGTVILVDGDEHRIVVSAPDHESRTIPVSTAGGAKPEITLAPGAKIVPRPAVLPTAQPTTAVAPQPPSWPSQHKASLALLGGGVALAIAGTAVSADILRRYGSFVDTCAAGCTDDYRAGMANQAVAVNVLFALAGAAGVAAVVVYFTAERTPSTTPKPQVGVSLGPTGGTLAIRY